MYYMEIPEEEGCTIIPYENISYVSVYNGKIKEKKICIMEVCLLNTRFSGNSILRFTKDISNNILYAERDEYIKWLSSKNH
jgi:hypothetical protein